MPALLTLGKHEIRRQLGRGAMGIVYEGFDPIIKRQVAIKTVRLPQAADDETAGEIARFRREAEAAGRLNHPNIVGVFDYGETADLAYIVMEFVDGPTLKTLLDKHDRFPLPRIVRIMEDLLAGLQFSHEHGVVHRDIKPANLMLTTSGQAKIADFGIARIESSSMTQAGTVLGTPAYMSPEQFMGQVADNRSDIYASGVLFYQLLTGERPFEGSMSSIMHKALNTEPPSPSRISITVPRTFDAVVRKAMAKRPEDRYSSAAEFASAIREAVAAPAPVPRAEPRDAGGEATVVAISPSELPASGTAVRPAGVRPASATAGIGVPTGLPPTVPSGAGAVHGPKPTFPLPGLIGAGVAGMAVLGGIGYFLLFGSPVAPIPPHEPAGRPTASLPTATPPSVATRSPADAGRAVALSERATSPAASEPSTNTPPVDTVSPSQQAATPPGPAAADMAPPAEPLSPPRATVPFGPAAIVAPPAQAPLPADPASPVSATAAPVPLPAAPAASQLVHSPLDRARTTARSVPCSALNVASDQDGLRISGFARAGPELERLRAEARDAGWLSNDITVTEQFACAPIAAVAAIARQAWESSPRTFAVQLDHREPITGTHLGIDVATVLPFVYVDLYLGDGSVRHLMRPASSAVENNPRSASVVAPAPGPGFIVAIGSPAPLDLGARPDSEKADAYLAVLQPRLRNTVPPPVADLAMVAIRPTETATPKLRPAEPATAKIRPVEPPATRIRPAEPAVAKVPPPHPSALRSSRCSNIVSRAQLGETLSNAEITALRTECRS